MTEEGKITEGKFNYELDWDIITLLAKSMNNGKDKYVPYAWKNDTNVEALKQALFRHTLEIMKNNYKDDEQEFGHLGAIMANVMMIYYQLKNNKTS